MTMIGTVQIDDVQRLIQDGAKLQENGTNFSSAVKTIYDIVGDLEKAWEGQAASRYVQNITAFKNDFETFSQLLTAYGTTVNSVGIDYQNLEDNL